MKKQNVLKTCYTVLRKTTPLTFDCGKLCDGKCCRGDEKTGMLLFPGEKELIDEKINIIEKDGHEIAVCNGACNRNKRPLACRIYPLFPLLFETGEIKVIFDYRANCPLSESGYRFNKRFIKAVKRVGQYLLLNEETAEYYKALSDELRDTLSLFEKISK